MKINYVLLYGCPYLQHREFETFDNISKFIVKKGITNYGIYELMDDKKEVEMILLNNDIQVLEKRINKALEYINNREWEDYPLQIAGHHKLKEEKEGKDLLKILRGEDYES